MPLPMELSQIFKSKQKSYKMVLILAILDELEQTGQRLVNLNKVRQRFLATYIQQDQDPVRYERPPEQMAVRWDQITTAQLKTIMDTPIQVLGQVLEYNVSHDIIGFRQELWEQFQPQTLVELRQYALVELEQYQREHVQKGANLLQQHLNDVLEQYVQAKRQPFTNHSLGKLFRQTIPQLLKGLPFIPEGYKIQGSVGMGNWADVPWIAIMDQRVTTTTQHGEYLVYLFSENMDAVYITFMQGVTQPLNDMGKKAGYEYFRKKVQEIRQLIPLDGFTKDDQIHLTNKGIGESYQVATVAYKKYERGAIPTDEVLIDDLKRLVDDYKIYVESTQNPSVGKTQPMFRYTMSHLYYGHGILQYLAQTSSMPTTLDELIRNYAQILKSSTEVQHPKERITHVGRAMQDLMLLTIKDNHYELTELGLEYAQHFNEDIWSLSVKQQDLLRVLVHLCNEQSSDLLRILRASAHIARELGIFTLEAYQPLFIEANGETGWNEVTQLNRTKFMLNWLEDLRYIRKEQGQYIYIEEVPEVEKTPVDVPATLQHIAQYIAQQGFQYPEHLIENFYLSLKTKPFVILAGISGTGKTKLVKLFAEAMGATSRNKQFTLIPVRPDWSDPSDLLGYKDLSGSFRPGPLTTALLEASKPANRRKPYFICLDEMNLARVEHYFSDILSILETQRREGAHIVTDTLLPKETLSLDTDLYIPDNVYIVGTVNMDETTHPFSKKVLDRANTLEFNYIQLEDYPPEMSSLAVLQPQPTPNSFLRSDYLHLKDAYADHQELIKETTQKLVRVNSILEEIHSHIGFRVRDSVCFYMIYNDQFGLMSQDQAFDIQLLQKILPRIQGSNRSVKRVLLGLMGICLNQSLKIEQLLDDASELIDKWRPSAATPTAVYPQSARKLAYMLRRLEEDGFTSFWLS